MCRPKVLITENASEEYLQPLDSLAEVIYAASDEKMPREQVLRLAPGLVAIINLAELRVDAELLNAGRSLKIIANAAVGVENFDLGLMTGRGVWAANSPDVFTDSTADVAIGLLLALTRHIVEADRWLRSGLWPEYGPRTRFHNAMLLSGKTLGIVGYGRIGRAVAKRARAFGMKVLFHDCTPDDDPAYRSLDVLLAETDVVSLHVPLTEQTFHLIDCGALARMKQGAILLNTARGRVVDEAALVEALDSGRLGGAGLDVFEDEPHIRPELLKMSNVVLTPHLGAGTLDSRRAARRLCAENVALVLRGKPPKTPVNQPLQSE